MQFAQQMAADIQRRTQGCIVFLDGPLGVGKTTLIRGLLQAVGYNKTVKSPSYSLVELYDISGKRYYHFDFYRLDRADDLTASGLLDYFFMQAVCLVEWAQHMHAYLPPADLICRMTFAPVGRYLSLYQRAED